MLGILAGMEQIDSYAVGWFCLSRCTSRCIPSENCGFSAGAVPRRSSIFPVAVRRSIPMVLLFSRPWRFPSCSCTCGRCPWLLIVLVSLSWRRGGLPWSRPVLDHSVCLMPDMVGDVPVAQVVQFILSLRRGCVSRSRLLLDQEILQLLDTVIDFPVAQVVHFVFFVVAQR